VTATVSQASLRRATAPELTDFRQCYTGGMKAHVWVMPKRTVLDPQGQTIQHALSGLGYGAVKDVRQGKFFVLNLDGWSRDEAQAQVERISKEVLTNMVIEEYRFEIVD
jgi:phosphoribosylformylglycinamidine synthase subunit PurS